MKIKSILFKMSLIGSITIPFGSLTAPLLGVTLLFKSIIFPRIGLKITSIFTYNECYLVFIIVINTTLDNLIHLE
ncbi:hypothetical protein [Mycoplasmopsis glycophila]|uniref:Uncharacterized protein n=1 Tax=Mycoplasmopsis glycophila TaxID=171285 RepID=A0A449AUD9_9BACT|nr:hypothetical protein [Mycoplasmopsis glycophila]VEU70139.1 Uncharacterised protein [Mycoplasmopsis glycophila]